MECNPCRAYLTWNYRKYAKQMLETETRTQGKKRKLDFREEVRDYEESKGDGRRSLKQTRIVSTDDSHSLEGRSVMRLGFLLPAGRVLLAKLDAGLLQFNRKEKLFVQQRALHQAIADVANTPPVLSQVWRRLECCHFG